MESGSRVRVHHRAAVIPGPRSKNCAHVRPAQHSHSLSLHARPAHDLTFLINHDQLHRITGRPSPHHFRRKPINLSEGLCRRRVLADDCGLTRLIRPPRLHHAEPRARRARVQLCPPGRTQRLRRWSLPPRARRSVAPLARPGTVIMRPRPIRMLLTDPTRSTMTGHRRAF